MLLSFALDFVPNLFYHSALCSNFAELMLFESMIPGLFEFLLELADRFFWFEFNVHRISCLNSTEFVTNLGLNSCFQFE